MNFLILVIGAIIYGIGAPSKTGRNGKLSTEMMLLGFFFISLGTYFMYKSNGVSTAVISFIGSVVASVVIAGFKK